MAAMAGQGVPMIGRGDQHDVEVLFAKHLAVVAIDARGVLGALPGGDDVGRLGEHALVDVAERHDFDGFDLEQAQEVALAVPAGADEADAAGAVGGEELEVRGEGDPGEAGGASSKELAAVHGLFPTFDCFR